MVEPEIALSEFRHLQVKVFVALISSTHRSIRMTHPDDRMQTTSGFGLAYDCSIAINGGFFVMPGHASPPCGSTRGFAVGDGVPWTGEGDNNSAQIYFSFFSPDGSKAEFDLRRGHRHQGQIEALVSGEPLLLEHGQSVVTQVCNPCTSDADCGRDSRCENPRKRNAACEEAQSCVCKVSPTVTRDCDRTARTGIGVRSNGDIVAVVAEGGKGAGENPDFVAGLTTREFGEVFEMLGVDTALNLDGGGSSSMYLRGKGLLNRPKSGESERAVATHVGFGCKKRRGRTTPNICPPS